MLCFNGGHDLPEAADLVIRINFTADVKIFYVTESLPFGVGETFALTEVEQLQLLGHEVILVPAWPRGKCFHRPHGHMPQSVTAPVLSLRILISAIREFIKNPLLCGRLLAKLSQTKTVWGLVKNLISFPKGLWLASVIRAASPDHVHAYWSSAPASISMVAAACSGVSWSFSAHRHDIIENSALISKLEHAEFARFISRDGIRSARLPLRLTPKIKLLHLGVELGDERREMPRRERKVIMCPASLNQRKGHEYLLDALALLHSRGIQCSVLLAGTGPLHATLEKKCRDLSLQKSVVFMGPLPHTELLKLYDSGSVDLVVLPSLHEGIPVSLMEAMARGIPVVATAVGGTPELLQDGAGFLVSPGNVVELASALELAITKPSTAQAAAQRGRERVRLEFCLNTNVNALVTAFQDSVASSRSRSESVSFLTSPLPMAMQVSADRSIEAPNLADAQSDYPHLLPRESDQ